MPHTVPGTGDTAVNKTGKGYSSLAHFRWQGREKQHQQGDIMERKMETRRQARVGLDVEEARLAGGSGKAALTSKKEGARCAVMGGESGRTF